MRITTVKRVGLEIFKGLSFVPWTINYSTVFVPSLVDFPCPVLAPPYVHYPVGLAVLARIPNLGMTRLQPSHGKKKIANCMALPLAKFIRQLIFVSPLLCSCTAFVDCTNRPLCSSGIQSFFFLLS